MNNASVKNVLLIVEGAKREPQLMERMFDSFSLADDHQIVPVEINVHDFLDSSFKNAVAISSPLILNPLSQSFFRIKKMRPSFSNPVLQTPCLYLT